MVDDVGPLVAIEPGDRGYRPRGAEGTIAAPPPGDRTQGKTLVADLFTMRAHPGRDDYLETSLARSSGNRCEQKYQSSVTKKRSFGRRPACGAADGDDGGGTGSRTNTLVDPALCCDRRLFNAFAARSLAPSGRRLRVGGSGLARIMVTGAAGFIGDALCRGLSARGHDVLGITRGPAKPIPGVE